MDKAKCSNLRVISGHFGATLGAPMAVGMQYAHLRLGVGGEETKNNLYRDIFMGRSPTSIVRQTKQNAATQGVSLVGLGPPWGVQ